MSNRELDCILEAQGFHYNIDSGLIITNRWTQSIQWYQRCDHFYNSNICLVNDSQNTKKEVILLKDEIMRQMIAIEFK